MEGFARSAPSDDAPSSILFEREREERERERERAFDRKLLWAESNFLKLRFILDPSGVDVANVKDREEKTYPEYHEKHIHTHTHTHVYMPGRARTLASISRAISASGLIGIGWEKLTRVVVRPLLSYPVPRHTSKIRVHFYRRPIDAIG